MGPYSESTEYARRPHRTQRRNRLPWGRNLRARNTTMVDARQSQMIELQWGRTLRARNTAGCEFAAPVVTPASMGPYSESTEYDQPGRLGTNEAGCFNGAVL